MMTRKYPIFFELFVRMAHSSNCDTMARWTGLNQANVTTLQQVHLAYLLLFQEAIEVKIGPKL